MPKSRQPKTHELKKDPEVFTMSWEGRKPYEMRFDDRQYQRGDLVIAKETLHSGDAMRFGKKPLIYTGRTITGRISEMVTGYGLQAGWKLLTIECPVCRIDGKIYPK